MFVQVFPLTKRIRCGQGGIGEALAKEYALRGLHPIATVLPSEKDTHLRDAGITCFHLDVTQDESILTLKRQVADLTEGFLDILVNNAGIAYTMTAIDTDVAEVQKMFDVNVFGPMRMVHHFHPLIIQATGTIVNIGSIGGIVPFVYGASYNATKAALHQWSNTLRVEMAPFRSAAREKCPQMLLYADKMRFAWTVSRFLRYSTRTCRTTLASQS
jgi:1-acylglycerone phosphate reductase